MNLEEQILVTLEFSLHYAGPMPFLERFQRIFCLDQENVDHDFKQVGFTARQFCKYMQRYGQFLDWKPSQIAAAAFMLSLNLNRSVIAPQVGLKALKGTQVQTLTQKMQSEDLCEELSRIFQQPE